MRSYPRIRMEMELQRFVNQHFKRPAECRNAEQARFYLQELSLLIQKTEDQYGYVPESVASLLVEYEAIAVGLKAGMVRI